MRRAALVALAAVASADLGERPLKRAEEVGFTGGWGSVKEARRLEMRTQAGWTWSFPGEPAAYAQRQEERKREILGLEHYQERLDNWVQYTQTRSVPNFTKTAGVVDIDPALHERLKTRLHAGLERARKEGEVQGIYGANGPTFVAPKTLDPALLEAAEAAAEAASDDPPPEETPRGLLRPDGRPGVRAAEHRRGDSKVADDLDDAEAELAETEGDDGSNLEFADDAGRSATGRKLKGEPAPHPPSADGRRTSARAVARARTKVEHDANKQAHRDAGKDDDDDDDEDDDDDDDEPEEDDDDDDDEVETIIGGGFVLAGLGYWIGGISGQRVLHHHPAPSHRHQGPVLKGVCGGKSKKDTDLPTFTPQK
ncbi:hypothetical protein SO694_00085040 [Aureococcus anophagefferens]|uniref:Uncharacterized protein n=1 Tax=Aureococcus anophagefferens TaxID=44056 RepID=A0ABR1G3M2_AURAN